MAKRQSRSAKSDKGAATAPREKKSDYRASWKGQLRFGLVSFGVQAVNALSKTGSEISFHQLHAPCHSRIKYKKVCPIHGEVSMNEIVSGYEYEKGQYVEFDKQELAELKEATERALSIDTFIGPADLDPVYLDGRAYYLIPASGEAQEPYVLFREAMKRQRRWGIGHVVISSKEQLALVRPLGDMLMLSLLNYDAEVRKPEAMSDEVASPKLTTRKIELAEKLIESWSEEGFDFSSYENTYQNKLKGLVESKVAGREIVIPEDDDGEPEVINLMEALQKSVRAGQRGGGRRGAAQNGRDQRDGSPISSRSRSGESRSAARTAQSTPAKPRPAAQRPKKTRARTKKAS